jgi:hypothetical protein
MLFRKIIAFYYENTYIHCVGEIETQVVHMVTTVFLRVRTGIESVRKTGLRYATCRSEHLTHLPPPAREMNLLQPRRASISLAECVHKAQLRLQQD